VLFLLIGGLFEDLRDLDETFLSCFAGKVGVAVPCLRLARESGE
jgi:hypothetical protein